jgi:hypothetical protein
MVPRAPAGRFGNGEKTSENNVLSGCLRGGTAVARCDETDPMSRHIPVIDFQVFCLEW